MIVLWLFFKFPRPNLGTLVGLKIYKCSVRGPENLKKSRPKKLVKSNKSISRNFILTKFHFLQFQKWPKINFWTGKKFKTAKSAISRKKIDLFDFTSFFLPGFFLIFWPAVRSKSLPLSHNGSIKEAGEFGLT